MFGFRTRRLLSSLAICLALAGNARATNLLVYNPNDSGAGSLRQASVDNRNLGGGNTIIFSNVVTGTITLTTGELSIDTNVTISGPGANALAVSGNHASRVFKIGSNSVVTISGLTITNGYVTAGSGGGIFNYNSTLTVSKCTVAGNSTSAGGFGGGIYSGADSGSATLSVIASTLSGNSASDGSGIYNIGWGTVTVVASTLSGNSASSFGGGIDNKWYWCCKRYEAGDRRQHPESRRFGRKYL